MNESKGRMKECPLHTASVPVLLHCPKRCKGLPRRLRPRLVLRRGRRIQAARPAGAAVTPDTLSI